MYRICYDIISGGKCELKFYPRTHSCTKPASRRWMGCCKLNVRMWAVSHAWSWIEGSWKQKKLTHSCFSKEQTSSFIVFVWTARIVFFPIKEHQSLGTAGPATGRTINSLCQAPSQMVLTMSWRVFLSNTTSSKCWMEEPSRNICSCSSIYVSSHPSKYIHPSTTPWGGSHPGIKRSDTPW